MAEPKSLPFRRITLTPRGWAGLGAHSGGWVALVRRLWLWFVIPAGKLTGHHQRKFPSPIHAVFIQECTEIFGASVVCEEKPAIEIYRDALYRPWSATDAWGVFTAEGRSIDAAINYLGPERIAKQPVWDIAPTATEYKSEEKFLYGGDFSTHFGHFLIDVLPRLWARKDFPNHKILFHSPHTVEDILHIPFVASAFAAMGLRREDIVILDRPTRIKDLIVPATSLREHAFVHRVFADLCSEIGDRLKAGAPSTAGPIVYLSKSRLPHGVGGLKNEVELEASLKACGVQILYPETLTLQDHAKLFTKDRVVVAATGSALHVSMFAPGAKILALNRNNTVVSTYKMLDALCGIDA